MSVKHNRGLGFFLLTPEQEVRRKGWLPGIGQELWIAVIRDLFHAFEGDWELHGTTRPGTESYLENIVDCPISWITPPPAGSSPLLWQTFLSRLARTHSAGIIATCDIGDLERHEVEEAFRILESGEADLVLGREGEDRLYLVGATEPHPVLAPIDLSRKNVFGQAVEIAEEWGLRIHEVRNCTDLRTWEKLLAFLSRADPERNRLLLETARSAGLV